MIFNRDFITLSKYAVNWLWSYSYTLGYEIHWKFYWYPIIIAILLYNECVGKKKRKKKKKKKSMLVFLILKTHPPIPILVYVEVTPIILRRSQSRTITMESSKFMSAGAIHWLACSLANQHWPVVRKPGPRTTLSSFPQKILSR